MGRKSIAFLWCALLTLSPTLATANISEEAAEIIAALKEQVEALVTRVESLESGQAKIKTETIAAAKVSNSTPTTSSPSSSWTDDFKITGDFRYRHEAFDVDNLCGLFPDGLNARANYERYD